MNTKLAQLQLGADELPLRREAAEYFRVLSPAESVPALCEVLRSTDLRARGNAAYLLGVVQLPTHHIWENAAVGLDGLLSRGDDARVHEVAAAALDCVNGRRPAFMKKAPAARVVQAPPPTAQEPVSRPAVMQPQRPAPREAKPRDRRDSRAAYGSGMVYQAPHDRDLAKLIGPTFLYGDDL